MDIVRIADAVGFAGFLGAVVVLALVPARADRRYNASTKTFTIAAFMVYVYSLGIDLFGETLANTAWDEIERFVEVLFPLFVLMSVVATLYAQQYIDVQRAHRALAASHDMMYSIVECAPAGILVLDARGQITFANDTARSVLDLAEDPETGDMITPGWTVVDREGKGRPDFRTLAEEPGRLGRKHLTVAWPDGWRVELDVYAESLADLDGRPAGLVATFERPRRDYADS